MHSTHTTISAHVDTRTPDQTRWSQWSGIAGLAATAAFLVSTLVSSTSGNSSPEGPADMTRYLDDVAAAETGHIVYAIAGLALCALYVPMSLAVTDVLRNRAAARLGTVATVVGLALLVPAYALGLGSTTGLVAARDGGVAADTLFGAHQLAEPVITLCFAAGSLLSLGAGPLLWGLAGRAGNELPTWLSSTLVAAGALGLVWCVFPIGHPMILVLMAANGLASLVTLTALSWQLARSS